MTKQKSTKCPCCGHNNLKVYVKKHSTQPIENAEDFFYGGHSFISSASQCKACQFIFLENCPTQDEIEKFYSAAEITYYLDTSYQRRIYFQSLYRKLDNSSLLDSVHQSASPILDIGAGSGEWLDLWKKKKYATESNELLIKILINRGIEVTPKSLDKLQKRSFSMISFFDFLEHIKHPQDFLNHVCSLMEPGGLLVIGVPDFGNLPARLFGKRYYLFTPMHLCYYNKVSMSHLLQRCEYIEDFKILKSPGFPITLKSLFKWIKAIRVSLPNSIENFVLPFGYSASLIAIARIKHE
ncbi:MAG: class I SAM-dependent methyltransferase [Bacteroidota bacterium]